VYRASAGGNGCLLRRSGDCVIGRDVYVLPMFSHRDADDIMISPSLCTDGAMIVARYVNQLKSQKRTARASRMTGSESGFQLVPRGLRYSTLPDGQDTGLLYSPYTPQTAREFDPYEEVTGPSYGTGPSYAYDGVPPPTADVDVGYGGESSMYEDISAEENGRLRQGDSETGISEVEWQANEEEERRRDSMSPARPPPARKMELPRYTLSDPPVNRAALVDNSGA
jgi:hypothetical protein